MAFSTHDDAVPARQGAAVAWLIGLCVGVFFVQKTLVGDANMAQGLGYAVGDVQRGTPWTVLSYMFVHASLTHLALNLWTLWLFGPRVERAFGRTTFIWFYLWCGVGGWAFHAMFQREGGLLVGASAAILGVAVAYASRWPDDEVLFFGIVPMQVRWLVAFMAAMNIVMAVLSTGSLGGTAYAAHIGGMVAGWLYLRAPSSAGLDRLRPRIAPAPDVGDEPPRAVPPRGAPRGRERDVDDIVAQSKAAVARSTRQTRPARDVASAGAPAPAPGSALDAVLDKIAAQGMASLTPAERLLLQEWSQRLRGPGA